MAQQESPPDQVVRAASLAYTDLLDRLPQLARDTRHLWTMQPDPDVS